MLFRSVSQSRYNFAFLVNVVVMVVVLFVFIFVIALIFGVYMNFCVILMVASVGGFVWMVVPVYVVV